MRGREGGREREREVCVAYLLNNVRGCLFVLSLCGLFIVYVYGVALHSGIPKKDHEMKCLLICLTRVPK